jgi:hypothetical protein
LDATLPHGHGFTAIRGHAPKVIHKGTEMGKGHVLHSFVFVLVARFCKLLVFLSSAYGVLFKMFFMGCRFLVMLTLLFCRVVSQSEMREVSFSSPTLFE